MIRRLRESGTPGREDIPPGLVDLHSHILPGLDDGSRSWDETLAMARAACRQGVAVMAATPHQLGQYAGNAAHAILERLEEARHRLRTAGIPLQLIAGGEVRVEEDLPRRIEAGEVLTLADARRYVLLELPHDLYLPLEGLLARLGGMGVIGILAHPERNAALQRHPQRLARLVEAGCLVQVTGASLNGGFGREVQAFTLQLIRQGMVHLVASDAHGEKRRGPDLQAAYRRIAEECDGETAEILFRRNPWRIMQGRSAAALELPAPTGGGILGRWFRKLAG
ncbi:MAG: protein tyrosine phosphatase [Thermogutta sp.]|nr:protein tyrosine phosphatase [Thermogutta sp.]